MAPDHPTYGLFDEPDWLDNMDDLAMFYLDFLDHMDSKACTSLVTRWVAGWRWNRAQLHSAKKPDTGGAAVSDRRQADSGYFHDGS